jgi:hypothetical protein
MAKPASIMVANWRVKNDEVREGDAAAARLALFADLFLDGNDQHIPVQQGRDGSLFRCRLDGTADFAAGGRFPGYV